MDERTPDDPRYAEQMARVMASELPEKWDREPPKGYPQGTSAFTDNLRKYGTPEAEANAAKLDAFFRKEARE